MHIACKCLNVSIKSRGTELQKVNINDIELTPEEQNDGFFQQVKIFLTIIIYFYKTLNFKTNSYSNTNYY